MSPAGCRRSNGGGNCHRDRLSKHSEPCRSIFRWHGLIALNPGRIDRYRLWLWLDPFLTLWLDHSRCMSSGGGFGFDSDLLFFVPLGDPINFGGVPAIELINPIALAK